jgi:hypothetical protein
MACACDNTPLFDTELEHHKTIHSAERCVIFEACLYMPRAWCEHHNHHHTDGRMNHFSLILVKYEFKAREQWQHIEIEERCADCIGGVVPCCDQCASDICKDTCLWYCTECNYYIIRDYGISRSNGAHIQRNEIEKVRGFFMNATRGEFAPAYVYHILDHAKEFYRRRAAKYTAQIAHYSQLADIAPIIAEYV